MVKNFIKNKSILNLSHTIPEAVSVKFFDKLWKFSTSF